MARFPEHEIERIKAEVSLVRLTESAGVALTKLGPDERIGLCPFHEDDTPSLSVSVAKNLGQSVKRQPYSAKPSVESLPMAFRIGIIRQTPPGSHLFAASSEV